MPTRASPGRLRWPVVPVCCPSADGSYAVPWRSLLLLAFALCRFPALFLLKGRQHGLRFLQGRLGLLDELFRLDRLFDLLDLLERIIRVGGRRRDRQQDPEHDRERHDDPSARDQNPRRTGRITRLFPLTEALHETCRTGLARGDDEPFHPPSEELQPK